MDIILPLYVFCGDRLLVSYLRESKIDGAKHAWAILALLVKWLRLTLSCRWTLAKSGTSCAEAGKSGGGGNNSCSKRASLISADRGQLKPADSVRRRYSPTVGRLTPQLAATRRLLIPTAHLSRSTSLILRIDNLFAGICLSPKKGGRVAARYPAPIRSRKPPKAGRQGGSLAQESVADFIWNTHLGWSINYFR